MATRGIVPRNNSEGSIGTAVKKWLTGYFSNIYGDLTGDVTGNLTGVPYLLQRGTAYSIGDIAHHSGLPKWGRLECVTAGTTAPTLPTLPTTAGTYVTDGTAKFILCDVRDMVPVGMVIGDTYLHSGYVKANGATVNRADYPRLTKIATDNSLFTSSQSSNLGLFGSGDGSTTMVLPNWIGKMAQFAATGGATVVAGLPNITGSMSWYGTRNGSPYVLIGAFNGTNIQTNYLNTVADSASGYNMYATSNFNASNSNSIYGNNTTVQPPAINVIPQIKY